MENKTCYIIGAGEMAEDILLPGKEDFVIAADAGYQHLARLHQTADLIVGDFDSLGSVPSGQNVIRHPVMKNDTDTMLAVKIALEKGYRRFMIYGGLGGPRLDHSLANIQMLSYIANAGGIGFLVGNGENITAITNRSIAFSEKARGTISVFSNTSVSTGVTLEGLLYPLTNATLTSGFPLGVSNEFTGKKAKITVKNGTLVVLWYGKFDKSCIL